MGPAAPEVNETIVMAQRHAAQLRQSVAWLQHHGLSSAAIGELLGLRANTVRRMLNEWSA